MMEILIGMGELGLDFTEYAERYCLTSHVKCNSKVKKITELPLNGEYQWEIESVDQNNPEKRIIYHAKAVAVCSGFNRVPKTPQLPGMDKYQGSKIFFEYYYWLLRKNN